MPEISGDFRDHRPHPARHLLRRRPGLQGPEARTGRGRLRLPAQAHRRSAFKSPYWPSIEHGQLIGLAELRKQCADDRQVRLRPRDRGHPRARPLHVPDAAGRAGAALLEHMCDTRPFAGVAREVVEAYRDETMGHPVGTGPFRLVEWRRSSRIVLERNPTFRDEFYDGQPAPTDERGQAMLARLKGKRMPFIDRVELSIIEESQPRWLSFLNGAAGHRQRAARVHRPGGAGRQGGAGARAQGDHAREDRQPRRRHHLLQHGEPGGGRLHAGEDRAAARDQPRLRRRGGDPLDPPRLDDASATRRCRR